ncbi:sortase [Rhizobium mesoamericanum]
MAMAAATAHDVASVKQGGRILPRLSIVEKIIAVCIAALALYGTALIADGLFIKAKAQLSHIPPKRAFAAERREEDTEL